MTDYIQLLPDHVANQIAAGEVIQRPASVVKELMENAIDAGATQVDVLIKDAGKTLVQVSDNGCGMSDTDARLSFERHATSKIKSVDDLFALHTMGFRGEALASIAAIAQIVLKTKKREEETGTLIEISGSAVTKQEVTACAEGTTFAVKNIFFNVPARRKFLKTDSTEFKHIIHEFQRVALANTPIAFTLRHNQAEVYNLPVSNLKQRIINVFGKQLNHSLINVNTETSLIKISGYTGKPEDAKKTPGEQYFFANNRFMRHPYLHKAVMKAYENLIPPGHYPTYFLYLDADPESIDVNIHPTKTEIKFADEKSIFSFLMATVRKSLGISNLMPSIDFDTREKPDIPVHSSTSSSVKIPRIEVNPHFNPFEKPLQNDKTYQSNQSTRAGIDSGWEKLFERQDEPEQQTFTEESVQSNLFMHFKNKYILTSVKSGLMIIDQKRAHQRILYEKFKQSLARQESISQQTLFPEHISLPPEDYALILELENDFSILGFDLKDFGNNTIIVQGIPSDIDQYPNIHTHIAHILEHYKAYDQNIKNDRTECLARSLSITSSIAYGQTLSQEEMRHLTGQLLACKEPAYSPSGKRVLTILSTNELEKRL